MHTCWYLCCEGAKLVGVIERDGNIVNREEGIWNTCWCEGLICCAVCVCVCVSELMLWRLYSTQTNGTIMGFPGATATEENLVTAECDILVSAAGERSLQTLPGI